MSESSCASIFFRRTLLGVLLALSMGACKRQHGDAEITIRNDLREKEHTTLIINQVVARGGSRPFSAKLESGKELRLPFQKITSLTLTRPMGSTARVYVVSCPAEKPPMMLKLIDVHLNRLSHGCRLSKRGESTGGIVTWERESS